MHNTAREVLDAIDQFLAQGPDHEARNLWQVLTALRGPDDGNDQAKDQITAPIRGAAFPRCLKRAPQPWPNPYGITDGKPRRFHRGWQIALPGTFALAPTMSGHFDGHAINAARALDLLPTQPKE